MAHRNGGHAHSDVQATTWLTPEQVERLRDACLDAFPAYLQDRNETIIAVLYDTGLRRSELIGLDTEHVDTDSGTIYVPGYVQKGDVPAATIELGKWGADSTRILKRYLRDRWKDTDALFPSRSSDRITGRSIARMVEKAAQHADVEPHVVGGGHGDPADVNPHTLRHSVAYRIIQTEGGQLEDVQLRLRHSSRETTDRIYSHLRPR